MASTTSGTMPLLQHLAEFRERIFKSAIIISVGFIANWFLYNQIVAKLAQPVCDLNLAQKSGSKQCGALYINGVLGPINLQIKVSLIAGLIVTAPLWIYQLWAFVSPGLHKHEKKRAFLFLFAATPFFAGGVTLGYLILPVAIRVLFGFTPSQLQNLINFGDYLEPKKYILDRINKIIFTKNPQVAFHVRLGERKNNNNNENTIIKNINNEVKKLKKKECVYQNER